MFSEKLKKLRKSKNLTQVQLGNLIGVSGAYIQQLENGIKKNASYEVILKICEVFDTSPYDLLANDKMIDDLFKLADEIDTINQSNFGYKENDKILYSPSELKELRNISDEMQEAYSLFENFLKSKAIQEDIGFKFEDIESHLKELIGFTIGSLSMKICEIKYWEIINGKK